MQKEMAWYIIWRFTCVPVFWTRYLARLEECEDRKRLSLLTQPSYPESCNYWLRIINVFMEGSWMMNMVRLGVHSLVNAKLIY